jgi:hypothetical protein
MTMSRLMILVFAAMTPIAAFVVPSSSHQALSSRQQQQRGTHTQLEAWWAPAVAGFGLVAQLAVSDMSPSLQLQQQEQQHELLLQRQGKCAL